MISEKNEKRNDRIYILPPDLHQHVALPSSKTGSQPATKGCVKVIHPLFALFDSYFTNDSYHP